ncbi:EAL domain-containing protein [Clostridium sp. YIM B02505]|uniref:EAL domain-containing protein n=1 Tax=Clostridium yunnanense TaxID=2800325 RepID=A0ABS1EX33_9CLOT|nr:EAL domain-containing protein [Clostridium yunnanense]MBK1813858.1 EAL domain-containing protein [Clostridium yunnanense]
MRYTITKKVRVFAILLVVTTVVCVSTIYFINANRIVKQSFEERSMLLMNTVDFSINNFTKQQEHIIDQIEKSNLMDKTLSFEDKEHIQSEFDGISETYGSVLNIYLAYDDGSYVVSPRTDIALDNLSGRSWYDAAVKGNTNVWSDAYTDKITGKTVITVSKALYKDGKLIGVLGIDFTMDSLVDYISNIKLGDTGHIMLLDSSYKIMAGYDGEQVGTYIKSEELTKTILSGSKKQVSLEYNGERKYCFYSKSLRTNWIIVGMIDEKEMNKYSKDILEITIITSLLIAILAIFLGGLVTKSITKNLKILAEDIEHIGAEDLKLRFDEGSKDEIAIIASHINNILDKLSCIIDSSSDAIWEYDIETDEITLSEKFSSIAGYKVDNKRYTLRSLIELIHPEDYGKASDSFTYLIKGQNSIFESEFRIRKIDGEYIWLSVKSKPASKNNRRSSKVYGSITDITLKKLYEKDIFYLAYYDQLTDLPNKIYFQKELAKEIEKLKESNSNAVVILIDVDNFKNINDTLGHKIGDLLLIEIATLLSGLNKDNKLIARIGGDEFLLLVRDVSGYKDIEQFVNKIQNGLKNNFYIEGKCITVSSSAGIVEFPKNGDNVEDIIRNADIAMYRAKESGKNKALLFDNDMFESFNRKIAIEQGLSDINYDNELEVHYQAQMDLEQHKLRGLEALLRWNSPVLGRVSPGEFIPIAEETGSIVPIGEWLIYKVFKSAKEFQTKNIEYNVISINISAVQLLDKNFLSTVQKALEETGIDSGQVEFEITETAIINNIEYSNEILNNLRKLGFKIVLDDFGTGYSSLSYLKMLPIEVLKIDKSFIDDINSTHNNRALLDGIIKLAHDLRMEVIAEGVEEHEQLRFLEEISCDVVQGYYFSKPVPYEVVEDEYKRLLKFKSIK